MNAVDDGRLVRPIWHPLVHQCFHEELRLYGVRAGDYREALNDFKDFYDPRLSVYEIFGDVDFLIRGYLNEEGRTYVENVLIPRLGTMAGAFILTGATGGRVVFARGKQVSPINRDLIRKQPHHLLVQAGNSWGSLPAKQRKELLSTGIALSEEMDPLGSENIRIFCFISHSLRIDRVHELAERLCCLKEIQPYLWELVVGGVTAGFIGNVLLELAVPNKNYENVIDMVRAIHNELSLAEPRTQTYLAANITHEYVDRCSFVETFDDIALRLAAEFPVLRQTPTSRQGTLVTLIEQLDSYLARDSTRPLARSLIEARIEDDTSKLRSAMAHLGGVVEAEVKQRLEAAAHNEWGEGWDAKILSELSMEKPLAEGWTLGEVLDATMRWNKRMLPPFLSESDIRKLTAFSALRNAAVHQQSRQKRQFEDYDVSEIVALALHALELLEAQQD